MPTLRSCRPLVDDADFETPMTAEDIGDMGLAHLLAAGSALPAENRFDSFKHDADMEWLPVGIASGYVERIGDTVRLTASGRDQGSAPTRSAEGAIRTLQPACGARE
jgi:hypothetical protein